MVAIPLTSGAYTAQSRTSNSQRCVNLYPEFNPPSTNPVFPVTHYPRPGLKSLSTPPVAGHGRCLYGATNGDLYAVVDQAVYYIDPDFKFHLIGNLLTDAVTPASMADNGKQAIIVDGSNFGYQVMLAGRTFTQIDDPNFLGSVRADFLDSFIILNKPNSNIWYCTTSAVITPFNALYFGIKTAWPDNVLCVVAIEGEVYVFGPKKSEVWYNAGAYPFPFQLFPGNIIEHGCAAAYSPAKIDVNVFWLSQSPEGDRMVMQGNAQNVAQRVSNHAIEAEWRTYPRIDDAIGCAYQLSGHFFYMIHFPTADKTWVFDATLATQLGTSDAAWHEDNWVDTNGILHRARNAFCAFAYGKNLSLDWATGALYQIDPQTTIDNVNGVQVPIPLIRSFPHQANELKWVSFSSFTADVATGESVNTAEQGQFLSPWSDGFDSGFGPISQTAIPQHCIRLSRNGGNKYGNNRLKTLISSGNYRTMQRWRGWGIARDAVFEWSSTAQMIAALNGAYIEVIPGTA